MSTNKYEINVDYIGVVAINNQNKAEYKQVSIDKCYNDLILKLEKASKDDNISLLGLQNIFVEEFKSGKSSIYYSYCYPYQYYESFIGNAVYPQIITPSEYKKIIIHYKLDKLKQLNELYFDLPHIDKNKEINKLIHSYLNSYINSLKENFARQAIRYVKAFQYYKELSSLEKNPINKMFSLEKIGRNGYEYTINKNIRFYLNSNFGYGKSSYFYVNLTYKGIDILPYSDIVKYYYANMRDFIRYTRLYATVRNSWDTALSFVVDITNQAYEDEEIFIKEWIIEEINKMISGLEQISNSPQTHLNYCIDSNTKENLIVFRNITKKEKILYKIYPYEFSIAYQAEKISKSLLLLDKLKALNLIYPNVIIAINKIINLNKIAYLRIKNNLSIINKEIIAENKSIEHSKQQIKYLKQKNTLHYNNIKSIIKGNTKDNINILIQKYIANNSDFKIDYCKIKELNSLIEEKKKDIHDRKNFIIILNQCIKRIEENLPSI